MLDKTLWVGIDVGAQSFFAAIDFPVLFPPQKQIPAEELESKEFKMTQGGVNTFLRWIDFKQEEFWANYSECEVRKCPICFVMEATGICSTRLEKMIYAVNPEAVVITANPEPIKAFRASLNVKNKTDKADAKVIARYGKERHPASKLKLPEEFQRLRDYSRARTFLKDQRTAMNNYHENIDSSLPRRMCTQVVKAIEKEIVTLDREIEKLVAAAPVIRHEVGIMTSMPGVGLASAVAILGELGSLKGYASRQKITAMSGLNPVRKQSGTSVNHTSISKKGSPVVRRFLYMDSKTALPRIPALQNLYDRLLAKGNTRMQARCAVMRKMLLILRGMVIADQPYDENYKKSEDCA